MSFAHEEWTGKDGKGKEFTLHAGDVVRMNSWGAFADNVILGFDGNGNAKVSRPYLYASLVGTTCAHPMMSCETYELPCLHILDHFKIMVDDGHFKGQNLTVYCDGCRNGKSEDGEIGTVDRGYGKDRPGRP